MSAITEQIHQLHDDVGVILKLRRVTLAQAIFQQVAHSNIQTLIIYGTHDDQGREALVTSTVTDKLTPDACAITAEEFMYHSNDEHGFNLSEHGNAGMAAFLESGIEWDDLMAILDEIKQWHYDIVHVFDLEVGGPALFINADGCWVTDIVYAEPEEEAAPQ